MSDDVAFPHCTPVDQRTSAILKRCCTAQHASGLSLQHGRRHGRQCLYLRRTLRSITRHIVSTLPADACAAASAAAAWLTAALAAAVASATCSLYREASCRAWPSTPHVATISAALVQCAVQKVH